MPLPYTSVLRGQRILVAEDSYLAAQEITEALEQEGGSVVGPAADLDDAWSLALMTPQLDAAVLDVNLRGRMVWPVADVLASRRVRLVFSTGYAAAAALRSRYGRCQVVEKPAPARMVVRLLVAGLPPA